MNQIDPNILREMREEREECFKVFNDIKNGTIDFGEFYYGFLDNMRNIEFDSGYSYALDNVEVYIKEAEGDIDYVSFLIHKERKRGQGQDV